MNENEVFQKLIDLHALYIHSRYDHWLQYELYTWQWWLLIICPIAFWLLWIKVVDRKKVIEILLYGLLIFIFTTAMDAIGIAYLLWDYQIKTLSKLPHIFSLDTAVFPVIYMLIYQYYPRWNTYLTSIVVMSAVFSFVGEPFLAWIGIYIMLKWKYVYSFPVFIAIGIICKVFVDWLVSIRQKNYLM